MNGIAVGVAVCKSTQTPWTPMALGDHPLSGFHWHVLPGDEAGSWEAYWMRVEPGATSPIHVHPSTELLLIHEGSLVDMDGKTYEAGDVVVFPAGSRHFTHSPAGCRALVVAGKLAYVSPSQPPR